MNLQSVLDKIPDPARDIKLNLESVLSLEGSQGLSLEQIAGVALSCAYAVEDKQLVGAISGQFESVLSPELRNASQSAAAIMAMNNVYYRFLHLCEDPEFKKLRAGLRMNVIAKPGIPKLDFELMSLAVSAIAGCGSCINSHVHEARKAGMTNEGVQSAVKIGAVVQAAHRVLSF